jgi:phosphoglycerate dehydrogenase-like enzyme/glyoxylase-like metal-dependent hydrolase (beta-lactamase superfamily II)
MKHRDFRFWVCVGIFGSLAAWLGPAFAAVGSEEEPMLPAGVTVQVDGAGRNQVAVAMGGSALAVDHDGTLPWSGPPPRYLVGTGADVVVSANDASIELWPASRSRETESAGSSIIFETDFTLSAAGRDVVFFDFGRGATAGDVAVWLPNERVVITGRLCSAGRVEATGETEIEAWSTALERLRDLEPSWVIPLRGAPGGPELIDHQIERIAALRADVEDGLLAGLSADQVIEDLAQEWFLSWREEDAGAADAALRMVFEELGGLRTPWRLIEERGLREGASPTRADEGWTRPTKVLWRNRWPERFAMLTQVAPGIEIIPFDSPDDAVELVADADALIGTANDELLAAGKRLRWVQVGSAGVERYLEIPRLGSGEVLLTNGQRLASPVIGEHVMALTRALARGLNRAVSAQVEGEWRRFEIGDNAPLTKLRGKTLLVVGLGGIGTEVARLADAAGMRVTAIRSSRRSGPPFVSRVGLTEDLYDYAARADVVVNCLPMTPATEDIFSAELFDAMKSTAFFVNVGRGGTVDTDALIAALENGVIAGAGLDVTDPEPLPEGHPLWRAPNLIITPHFAAWSDAGRELHWLLFRENLRRFFAGEPLLSVVDPQRGY